MLEGDLAYGKENVMLPTVSEGLSPNTTNIDVDTVKGVWAMDYSLAEMYPRSGKGH